MLGGLQNTENALKDEKIISGDPVFWLSVIILRLRQQTALFDHVIKACINYPGKATVDPVLGLIRFVESRFRKLASLRNLSNEINQ